MRLAMVNFEFYYADHEFAGIFKKVGDMTFILNTDLLSDDFEEGKRKKRNAVLDTRKLWPGGVVPYEISSYFDGYSLTLVGNMCILNLFLKFFCRTREKTHFVSHETLGE